MIRHVITHVFVGYLRDGAAIGRNGKGFDMANIIRTIITRICQCVCGSTYMHKGVVYSVPCIILQ